MSRFEETLEVEVPIRVAYDQWTRFREFPEFMEGIDSVEPLDPDTLVWVGTVAGRRRAWRTRIVERTPDVRVAWQTIEGPVNDGAVRFHSLGLDRTLVTLCLDTEPDGPIEAAGTPPGSVGRLVHRDLRRFKAFVEANLVPAGPWRGQSAGRPVAGDTMVDVIARR